jgi:hypothetical protein
MIEQFPIFFSPLIEADDTDCITTVPRLHGGRVLGQCLQSALPAGLLNVIR